MADDNIESVWVYQRWQPLNEIASMVQLAVIAAEDQKFSQYYGFNFKEIKKIITQKGGSSRGASTISQQLVKNVFLWKGNSISCKVIEVYITLVMELLLPRERIL